MEPFMTKIIMSVSHDSFAWLITTLFCFAADAGVFFPADTRGVEILRMFFFEQGIMGMDKVVDLFNFPVVSFFYFHVYLFFFRSQRETTSSSAMAVYPKASTSLIIE